MASVKAAPPRINHSQSKSPHRPTKLPAGAPPEKVKAPFEIESISAFYLFFISHIIAAIYSPIQDCDEVFNYWEPTHYLNHGHGLQTWEYSPEYAIRSWTYTGLHSLVALLGRFTPGSSSTKVKEFYFLRISLAFLCALCESRLFSKLKTTLNPRVAIIYLLITLTAPGFYHASVAYLPSSFSMYFTMLGYAAFMDWRGGLRTAQGIWCFGISACLGWPFAIVLAMPFLLEELFLAWISDYAGLFDLAKRVLDGVVRSLLILITQIAVDWFFYKRVFIVPLNIVWYNVFSGKGPDLYGTEPWHYYVRNLFLNFHVWFVLALLALPLLLVQQFLRVKGATKASYLRGIVFLTPFYLWLAIFTLQPHKEERFMYPAYPALVLNAAFSLHIIVANLGSTDRRDLISAVPVQLRLTLILTFLLTTLILTIFRVLGTITAFSAPLTIYQPLHNPSLSPPDVEQRLCLGKEWHRFPSHYLLPPTPRAKFIRSDFTGLLPGDFSEAGSGFGLFPGTWLVPPGMNDENREDVGKYTELRRCDFLVDVHLPSTNTSPREPDYVHDTVNWERVECVPFLDSASTGWVGRLGWVPEWEIIPARFRRVWGEYCLLKKRKNVFGSEGQGQAPRIETLL